MQHLLLSLFLCLYMLPLSALAQTMTMTKDPLSYPISQYLLILTISVIGGIANWVRRIRKGELQTGGVGVFIGELATSAFSGVIVFWICEYFEWSRLLSAAGAGLAGHAGSSGLLWAERVSKRYLEKRFGVNGGTAPAPLGPPEFNPPRKD